MRLAALRSWSGHGGTAGTGSGVELRATRDHTTAAPWHGRRLVPTSDGVVVAGAGDDGRRRASSARARVAGQRAILCLFGTHTILRCGPNVSSYGWRSGGQFLSVDVELINVTSAATAVCKSSPKASRMAPGRTCF
jgi:hypothetical protein